MIYVIRAPLSDSFMYLYKGTASLLMSLPYLIMAFLLKAATRIIDKILKHLLEEEDSGNNRTISLAILMVIVTVIVVRYFASCVIAKISTVIKDLRAEVKEDYKDLRAGIEDLRAEIRTLKSDMIHTSHMAERCKDL